MKYLDVLAGDDQAFRKRFIDILKAEFPKEREAYSEAVQHEDWKSARELVHKIKHKISILGMEKAYELANQHEEGLLNDNTRYQQAFAGILETIEQFIKQLEP